MSTNKPEEQGTSLNWTLEELLKEKGFQLDAASEPGGKPATIAATQPSPAGTKPQAEESVQAARSGPGETEQVGDLVVSMKGPFRSIAKALAAVAPGGRILVEPGLYKESFSIDKPVEIRGTRHEDVVVEVQRQGILVGESQVKLEEITFVVKSETGVAVEITAGEPVLERCEFTSRGDACIWIHGEAANPSVVNCLVRSGSKDGIRLTDGAQGMLEGCRISGHRLAGIRVEGMADPIVRDCRIEGNQVGVASDLGLGSYENCTVSKNGIGFRLFGDSDPMLSECLMTDNAAGCLLDRGSKAKLESCRFEKNRGVGLIVGGHSEPRVQRSNFEGGQTGALFRNSGGSLESCSFSGNLAFGLVISGNSTTRVNTCFFNMNRRAAILLAKDANPTLAKNCLLDRNTIGVVVTDDARGTFHQCRITKSVGPGLWIRRGGSPSLDRECLVADGESQGIMVEAEAGGSFACHVERNAGYGIEIGFGCELKAENLPPADFFLDNVKGSVFRRTQPLSATRKG